MQVVQATNTPSIRELGVDEIEAVAGGPVPILAVVAVAVVGAAVAGAVGYVSNRQSSGDDSASGGDSGGSC